MAAYARYIIGLSRVVRIIFLAFLSDLTQVVPCVPPQLDPCSWYQQALLLTLYAVGRFRAVGLHSHFPDVVVRFGETILVPKV